ncbi:molybdenum cofactor guanylyltransferase [Ningiella sp. W23]|uniref:molybdenum cofactor guanylyltransferase n=1 Tax=Ningiella sp. W23 TaxID=3023715 RepID=UPI003757C6F5
MANDQILNHSQLALNATIGIVLAGGQSSRMSTDKASLKLKKQSMLDISTTCLKKAGVDEVYVSSSLHGGLRDLFPNCGPAAALVSSIKQLKLPEETAIVALPVDMPLVSSQLIHDLLAASLYEKRTVHYTDHSHISEYIFPCVCRVNNRLISKLSSTIASGGNLSMHALLEAHDALKIPLDKKFEKMMNTNINTPQQWQAFLKTHEA